MSRGNRASGERKQTLALPRVVLIALCKICFPFPACRSGGRQAFLYQPSRFPFSFQRLMKAVEQAGERGVIFSFLRGKGIDPSGAIHGHIHDDPLPSRPHPVPGMMVAGAEVEAVHMLARDAKASQGRGHKVRRLYGQPHL